jgi:hypothetical protein
VDVDPEAGVTVSQLGELLALAWKLAVPPAAVTVNIPGDTVPPLPTWKLKLSSPGLTEIVGSLTTLRDTVTTTAVPPVGVIVMVPV